MYAYIKPMIKIIKKVKPNNKLITDIRNAIGLTQQGLLKEINKMGYTISRRTYQRIENGDDTQPIYIEKLSKFFNRYSSEINNIPIKNLGISDLIISAKDKKNNPLKGKKIPEVKNEKCYLYKIDYFEEIQKLILKSDRRKFFFPLTPSEYDYTEGRAEKPLTEKNAIESIVNLIDEIFKSKDQRLNPINNERYGDVKNELDLLKNITTFGEHINFLNSKNIEISLYAGNFTLNEYGFHPKDPHPNCNEYVYKIIPKIISILCFKRDTAKDLNFNYDNYWHYEQLQAQLEIHNMSDFEVSDDNLSSQMKVNEFQDSIKYFSGIDVSKVSFDHHVPYTTDDSPFDIQDVESFEDYPGSMDDLGD